MSLRIKQLHAGAATRPRGVLAFVRKHGNPTSAEVAKHWLSEGRSGNGSDVLSRLVGKKKLEREALKDGRGSRYWIA